mmetsp:Transcript_64446/g.153803  ORF Transcript_64446/g.153803 Transcript_64446/m.153803 type:complete len:827 (+) Transcript_64446:133-2613(+)
MSTRKKVRQGPIEVNPEEWAVVVNYTLEIQHLDDRGMLMGSESQPGQKLMRVPHGLTGRDLRGMAAELVEKCKYVQASRVAEVEHVLRSMAEHEEATGMVGMAPHEGPGNGSARHGAMDTTQSAAYPPGSRQQERVMSASRHGPPPPPAPCGDPPDMRETARRKQERERPLLPDADVRLIEEYTYQLYEDSMEKKVFGAKCILRVCTEPRNLELLADHENLLGVLSRELRENSKKSFELSLAIVCTFLCFSHFSQFHPLLMQHQCGDATLRVVEYESQRHVVRKEDYEKKVVKMQDPSAQLSAEDKKQLAKDEKRYKLQLAKQNKLMLVCQMMLLNLAEDAAIEKKMVNRKMPVLLVQLLDRTTDDVLIVALQFLKKLAIFEDNKDVIAQQPEALTRLVQLVSNQNVRVALLVLRTLYNLSFDEAVRTALMDSPQPPGIVKLLVDHLRNPPFRHIVLLLLYHFSMDDRCKSLMAYYQDGMVMLLQLVVHFPEPRVGKDLVALVVNLATHPRAAEVIVSSGLFPQVMMRVLKTRDPLLCKVIRHVSSHKEVAEKMHNELQGEGARMAKWMVEFVRMALCCVDNPDLLVELLGTLANMTLPEVSWSDLCEAGLLDLLHRLLVVGFSEDDIILECVMIVGNMALSRDAGQHLALSRVPTMLQDLLVEKREDEEIILQLLFTFQCLLMNEEVRDIILQDTDIATCVLRFTRVRNPALLEQVGKTLQVIAEYSQDMQANSEGEEPSWAEQIKAFRFEQHNSEWCQHALRDHGNAAYREHLGYYDDQGSGAEDDEEEFAFHWGDAVDARVLANRDWGRRQDLGTFMSSRYVS